MALSARNYTTHLLLQSTIKAFFILGVHKLTLEHKEQKIKPRLESMASQIVPTRMAYLKEKGIPFHERVKQSKQRAPLIADGLTKETAKPRVCGSSDSKLGSPPSRQPTLTYKKPTGINRDYVPNYDKIY